MSDSSSEDPQTEPTIPVPVATEPAAAQAPRIWRVIDRGPRARSWHVISIVLLVLGCVLAPVAVATSWAKNLVVDQQAYLDTVDPLATNPVIINAAETRAVKAIDDAITSLNLADKLGNELQSLGLPPKLATLASTFAPLLRTQITDVITTVVDRVLTSEEFQNVWTQANARAHTEFVTIMKGEETGRAHTASVDLSSLVAKAKARLEANGVSWASQIPDIPIVFNLADNADVQKLQGYYNLLDTLGMWLPIVAIVLLIGSILIAPSRVRGIFRAGLWLAVSMVVLALGLVIGRYFLVDHVRAQPDVTKAFFGQLTVNLQNTIRVVLISAIVVAVVAFLFGPSSGATSLRAGVRGLAYRVQNSHARLAVQIVAGVIAVVLVVILVTLDDPGVLLALILAVLASLAGVIAASAFRRAPTAAVTDPVEAPAADRTSST